MFYKHVHEIMPKFFCFFFSVPETLFEVKVSLEKQMVLARNVMRFLGEFKVKARHLTASAPVGPFKKNYMLGTFWE